jgi:hypothetical protein
MNHVTKSSSIQPPQQRTVAFYELISMYRSIGISSGSPGDFFPGILLNPAEV